MIYFRKNKIETSFSIFTYFTTIRPLKQQQTLDFTPSSPNLNFFRFQWFLPFAKMYSSICGINQKANLFLEQYHQDQTSTYSAWSSLKFKLEVIMKFQLWGSTWPSIILEVVVHKMITCHVITGWLTTQDFWGNQIWMNEVVMLCSEEKTVPTVYSISSC